MSQSCFSQNSLWKLSTFRGYKGIYSSVHEECEKSIFYKTGHSSDLTSRLIPTTSSSREITNWLGCHFCPIVLQLCDPLASCMLHTYDILAS